MTHNYCEKKGARNVPPFRRRPQRILADHTFAQHLSERSEDRILLARVPLAR